MFVSMFPYTFSSFYLLPYKEVADAIYSATTFDTPCEDLKTAVFSSLEFSVTTRLRKPFSKELRNDKPSGLLRRMKRLFGDKYESFD